ncbi:unnamed protein product [Urochloa humidicola]
MAAAGGSGTRPRSGPSEGDEAHVADLLDKLNLTQEEVDFAALSDDEDAEGDGSMQWAVIGKVLSPSPLHISTIRDAMLPAWGNPYGLKFRSVGERPENLFIAEFGGHKEKKKAVDGSPWIVGRHAVMLQEYDETLRPSDVCFDRMEMWVRILNLPFGWMNERRRARAAGLIGSVVKVDVDADGKASGPFLRARVAVEVDKPLHRGVLLKTNKEAAPEWFDIQFEKLPFYCFSCGRMGHTKLECPTPAKKNALGKLPYEVALRAPDEKKKKLQSFGQAAAESRSNSRSEARSSSQHSSGRQSANEGKGKNVEVGEEATSPLKATAVGDVGNLNSTLRRSAAAKTLFQGRDDERSAQAPRKRKSEGKSGDTPDLNLPAIEAAVVPQGLVTDRIAQLGSASNQVEEESEVQKKQKTANKNRARSARAAADGPRRAQ